MVISVPSNGWQKLEQSDQVAGLRTGIDIQSFPLAFKSSKETLRGELLLPDVPWEVPGVVLCHGLASDHRSMRSSAEILARQGIAAFAFDFRGHGKSTGVCDGNLAVDVIAATQELVSLPRIDRRHIGLVGHSMGARAAILAAAELDGVSALAALACPPDETYKLSPKSLAFYRSLLKKGNFIFEYPRIGQLPWLGGFHGSFARLWMWLRGYRLSINWRRSLRIWSRIRVSAALKRMRPRPVLFLHCRGDRQTPYQASVDLFRQASEPKELILLDGGFHSSPLLPGKVRDRWIGWLITKLQSVREEFR